MCLHYCNIRWVRNFSPAPGHYETEKVKLDQSPRYSFGVKTVAKVISNSPGKIFKRTPI